MQYWLMKSEPFKYSWQQLVEDKKTFWDGVRNYAARNNMKAMKKGDLVFFYHSNEGKEIVGIAKVVKEFYQDPTIDDDRWVAVDIKAVKPMKTPVSLAMIKAEPKLKEMELVRLMRLSVGKVSKKEFEVVLKMGEVKL
jgi:predicted RNA-binding protein with PUA-like domain